MLNTYVKNGLVTTKAGWYSIVIEGEQVKLGQAKAAEGKLKALISDGKVPSLPINEPSAKSGTSSKSSNTLDVALAKTSETTPKKNSKLEQMLGQIRDINPDYSASNLTVLIEGISYLNRSNPVVANYPLEFYWLEKKNSVDSGNGTPISNGDYTVFDKSWAFDDDGNQTVTWKRDDTPTLSMITVGTLVLCCCKREQFYDKKNKQQMKGQIAPLKVHDQRQEQARGAAKIAEKHGPEASTSVYETSAAATKSQAAEVAQVSNGISLKEAEAQIASNDLTPDRLRRMIENKEVDIDSL